MDLITLGASNSYTYEKIKEIETGISQIILVNGNILRFVLADNTNIDITMPSQLTEAQKDKLVGFIPYINNFLEENGKLKYNNKQLLTTDDLPKPTNADIGKAIIVDEGLNYIFTEIITDYNELINKPFIPSIEGLASEEYVDNKLATLPSQDLSEYEKKLDNDLKLSQKAEISHIHEMSTINGLSNEFVKYYLKTETYNQNEINELIANIVKSMNWKESKDTQDDLPLVDNVDSDVRITKSDNMLNMWIEAENKWIQLISMNNINLVSNTLDGLMSKEDKIKLDNIIIDNLVTLSKLNEELNKKSDLSHTHINYVEKEDGKSLIEDSKIAKIDELMSINIPTKTSDLANDSGYINNDNLDEYLKLNSLLAGDNIEITNDENGTVTIKSTASGLTEEQLTNMEATDEDINNIIGGEW